MKTFEQINKILFNVDPMNTGCRENDLHDEYVLEAEEISLLISSGKPIEESVKSVFDKNFWNDALRYDTLKEIVDKIEHKTLFEKIKGLFCNEDVYQTRYPKSKKN